MKKNQRVEKLQTLRGKIRGFFIDNYNDNYPSMKQMLNDIEKVQDPVYRFFLTFSLIGDATENGHILAPVDELVTKTIDHWVEGFFSDSDLEELRKQFLARFGKRFIYFYDRAFSK